MDCPYCQMPYMEWRMDEVVSKNRLYDTNIGTWHDCKESPQAKKKKADEEWRKKREEVLLEERKKKKHKLTTPVYCPSCNESIKPTTPCNHMREDGFELGVDGAGFYDDSKKSEERRKQLKEKMKVKTKPKPMNLDRFS